MGSGGAEMIPLGAGQESRYTAWLVQRHPVTWRHYLAWLRSLRRAAADGEYAGTGELQRWLESYEGESRRAARKGMRKYLQWAAGEGWAIPPLPSLAKAEPGRTLGAGAAERLRQRESGTLKDRQIALMALLYLHTELPASAVGQLRLDHLAEGSVVWRGREHALDARLRDGLRRWLRLRERIRALPEERRRHRKTGAWSESEWLFPNARGGPSRYGVIWRARQEG